MQDRDNLYVASHGRVICIQKRTGKELWRTKLLRWGGDITTILVESDVVYAAARGEIFALNPDSGAIHWRKPMKAGGGVCILASDSQVA